QMAELAGHPRVAVLLGGLAAWPGDSEVGQVELQPVKTTFEPSLEAVPTREELVQRLEDPSLTILDVRTTEEYRGKRGYPCDPRERDLGMELHAPGTVAEPERLRAEVVARELHCLCRQAVRVVMPLECGKARRQAAQQRIVVGVARQLHREPADLRLAGGPNI